MSKKSRKLFGATASAALVASAIVPVASVSAAGFNDEAQIPSWASDAVNYLVDNGVLQGDDKGNFNADKPLTRAEAATILAKTLGLEIDEDQKASFSDAKDHWASAAIAALQAYDADILNGYEDGTFKPDQTITRQELAKIVVTAFDLELDENADVSFADNTGWGKDYVNVLASLGVVEGVSADQFDPEAEVTRAQAAVFVHRTEVPSVRVEVPSKVVEVDSVNATSPSTLVIEGKGLQLLKAEDVSVSGNEVLSVTSGEDGKTATVTLDSKLAPNADVQVSVTANGETKEFTTKFEYKVTSVSIDTQSFDDDRAGQKVKFKVNGEEADIDYLQLAGYTVTFVAKNSSGAAANGFFADNATGNTSSTGVISHPVSIDEYTVEVQVTKAGEALVTDTATIKVINIDAEATAINSVAFYNYGSGAEDDSSAAYNGALLGDDYVMNSTTLVAGEKLSVYKIEATVAGEKTVVPSTDFEVETSNPAVVSVDSSNILTAESAGTATITVKVGDTTKTFNFTVTNTKRELSKVTVNPSSVSIVEGYTKDIKVKTLDQYGDPYSAVTSDINEVVPVGVDGSTAIVSSTSVDVVTDTPDSIGEATLNVSANKEGKGTVYFKDSTGKVLGSFYVNVSAVDNTGSKKLEITSGSESTDTTLDLQDTADDTVTYQLSRYNSQGVYIEPISLENYTLEVVDGTVAGAQFVDNSGSLTGSPTPHNANATITGASGDVGFQVTGLKAGKTDILLKDKASGKVEKITVTVENTPIEIKSVNFKSVSTVDYSGADINYEDVLDVTYSNADDIVNGVTLSKSTLYKVRISEDSGTEGVLYLDVNGDASYTSGTDTDLGKLIVKATADSTLSASITDAVAGYTTATTDKGTLLFKVLTDVTGADETTSIAATYVTVDVK